MRTDTHTLSLFPDLYYFSRLDLRYCRDLGLQMSSLCIEALIQAWPGNFLCSIANAATNHAEIQWETAAEH
jgi:hypothetical protein